MICTLSPRATAEPRNLPGHFYALLGFTGAPGPLNVPFLIRNGKIEEPEPAQYDGDRQQHGWSYNALNSNPGKQLLQRN